MLRVVITYVMLSLCASGVMIAQDAANIRGNATNNMTDGMTVPGSIVVPNSSDQSKRIIALKNSIKTDNEIIGGFLLDHQMHREHPQKVERKTNFNIVSSFRENIRFGGMWDKYAIINFTPSLNIKPFDFLSINANQNLSCLVPIKGIKENFKILSLQSASLLVVDNAFKLLFGKNDIIEPIIGFALKLLITTVAMQLVDVNIKERIYSYNSYSYSMHITF